MSMVKVAISLLLFLQTGLSSARGWKEYNASRRVKVYVNISDLQLSLPGEYKGLIQKLSSEDENQRLDAIDEIAVIIREKEENTEKGVMLLLALAERLSDRQESVRKKASRTLRRLLPGFEGEFQIAVGLKIIDFFASEEDYLRWGATWGLKKIFSALSNQARKVLALKLVDQILFADKRTSWTALQALEKIIDYLNYSTQKEVVMELERGLMSPRDHTRENALKAFISIIPRLKTRVLRTLQLQLKTALDHQPPKIKRGIEIVIETLRSYLKEQDTSSALKGLTN